MVTPLLVMLQVVLYIPSQGAPIFLNTEVESLSVCWAMAKEILAEAHKSPTLGKDGGEIVAGCKLVAPKIMGH